jgi:hypothetical protein
MRSFDPISLRLFIAVAQKEASARFAGYEDFELGRVIQADDEHPIVGAASERSAES